MKLRGRHKTQRVWQQLKPLIRNELLLLLSADRQTNGNSKTQKAIPEGERYKRDFFPPITFTICLQTFIQELVLHHWFYLVGVFWQHKIIQSNSEYHESLSTFSSAQNTIENTTYEFQSPSCVAPFLSSAFRHGSSNKGFLMPRSQQWAKQLIPVNPSAVAFKEVLLVRMSHAAAHNLTYSSVYLSCNPINRLACAYKWEAQICEVCFIFKTKFTKGYELWLVQQGTYWIFQAIGARKGRHYKLLCFDLSEQCCHVTFPKPANKWNTQKRH